MIRFSPADGLFSLRETLSCGQSFRWRRVSAPGAPEAWHGVAFGHALTAVQAEGAVEFDCTETEFREIWFDYFDLGADYAAARARIAAAVPQLRDVLAFAPGIRLLRQEPWEGFVTFLLSQCNNIPRIEGIVERLCAAFGEEISPGEYAFPGAERLASCELSDLAPLHAGYRAQYVLAAAQRAASGALDLEALRDLPLEAARAALMALPGVGRKVADCALLYGLHRTECFPVDVWMKRALTLLPGLDPARLGADAGLAQQYIFHAIRNGRLAGA